MQQAIYQKLLALQNSLFDLDEYNKITDFIVNDSYKIIPYQLAVVFEYHAQDPNKLDIVDVSGIINSEVNADFHSWLKHTINHIAINSKVLNDSSKNSGKDLSFQVIHPEDLEQDLKLNWAENLGEEIFLVNLYSNNNKKICIILFSEEKYDDNQVVSFLLLVKSYQQALKLNIKEKSIFRKKIIRPSTLVKVLLIIAIVAMFVPVVPSVMAPAEIISKKSWSINAPINGIIKKVLIEPNSIVKKDQILFTFDQLDLKNNVKIKEQELNLLETDQKQARALGFNDREERAKIYRLKQDIAAKKQEVIYAKEQLNLSIVKAPSTGVVLFKSEDDLLGKPIKVGQTVMQLADVKSKKIEIWLDVNDSIDLKRNMKILYYSNKDPFVAMPAKLEYFSYEAYITPQNKISYRLVGVFDDVQNKLIIGDHGQIKVYGESKVMLGEFLFRKPLAKLRQWFYKVI